MDRYMHKTMASIGSLEKIEIIRGQKFMATEASLEKIEIIRSQQFMVSEARLKFLKK